MRASTAISYAPLALLSIAQAVSVEKRALEAPLQFDSGWEYQGCYMYVTKHICAEMRLPAAADW
jgi:hypothetical protein